MLKIFSFTLLIISFVLISCTSDDEESSSSYSPPYATSTSGANASGTITIGSDTISGTYATACFSLSSSTGPSDATHIGFVAVVTGADNYTRETNYYTDSACTAESLSLGWYYNMDNVTIGDASGSAYKQTYTEENQTFMAKTTAADTYITELWSAYSIDFEVGTAKVLDTGFFNYNLIRVSDGSLYFGSQSTSAYPSTVSSSKHVKQ